MSILSNGSLSEIFSSAFSSVFEDGQLIRTHMKRDDVTGSMRPIILEPIDIKIQIDKCTEAMRQQQGYSDDDVRLLILQGNVQIKPTSNDTIIAGNQKWKLYGISEDPAHTYWQGRAVRQS